MAFKFYPTDIPDVLLIKPRCFEDHRGFFMETYKASEFQANGVSKNFRQTNHSRSGKGVLRGLHYQLNPAAQGKLVRAVSGTIFDVAVDLRKSSSTYGRWVGEFLSAEDKNMLYIPEGFAHGFCVISETAEILYSCTHEYVPDLERGIAWNDPTINIQWPVSDPILSERDRRAPLFASAEKNFS